MTNHPESSTPVTISPETDALVEQEMSGQNDEVKQETKALIEAIKKRAQSEIQTAQDLTGGEVDDVIDPVGFSHFDCAIAAAVVNN